MKNVFQLWVDNGKRLPLKVRRFSWHPSTYFVIKEIRDVKWDYFERTGGLYGKAYGDMYVKGRRVEKSKPLGCAGCYQWETLSRISDPMK